jgi:hypothetical protein
MNPPNRMQTAKVSGGETPLETLMMSKKYMRKRYTTLTRT